MELRIKNGDYVLDGAGGAETLSGSAEIVQRVLYKLTARRAGFPFIPTLGSELYRLGQVKARERQGAAETAVRQALDDERELEIRGVELTEAGGGLYRLKIDLNYQGQEMDLALTVQ